MDRSAGWRVKVGARGDTPSIVHSERIGEVTKGKYAIRRRKDEGRGK